MTLEGARKELGRRSWFLLSVVVLRSDIKTLSLRAFKCSGLVGEPEMHAASTIGACDLKHARGCSASLNLHNAAASQMSLVFKPCKFGAGQVICPPSEASLHTQPSAPPSESVLSRRRLQGFSLIPSSLSIRWSGCSTPSNLKSPSTLHYPLPTDARAEPPDTNTAT